MIEQLVQTFQTKYPHLKVDAAPIDLTACFYSREQRYFAPRAYGDLTRNKVLAYLVFGGTFVDKYAKDQNGHLLRQNGHPVIKPFDGDLLVMSSLCGYDLRSTSLHEVKNALQATAAIQGFHRWHIKNIEEAIKKRVPAFDPAQDSAFLFCDEPEKVLPRLTLSALWFAQIIDQGRHFFAAMDATEARLMERIFPETFLAGDHQVIRQRSYMYGRPIHTSVSVEFLAKKVDSYRQWRTKEEKNWNYQMFSQVPARGMSPGTRRCHNCDW